MLLSSGAFVAARSGEDGDDTLGRRPAESQQGRISSTGDPCIGALGSIYRERDDNDSVPASTRITLWSSSSSARYRRVSDSGYPWSGVRPSSSTMLKHLLWNRFHDQSKKKLCGASFGRGNENLFAGGIWVTWPRWPPRPYMVKTL